MPELQEALGHVLGEDVSFEDAQKSINHFGKHKKGFVDIVEFVVMLVSSSSRWLVLRYHHFIQCTVKAIRLIAIIHRILYIQVPELENHLVAYSLNAK